MNTIKKLEIFSYCVAVVLFLLGASTYLYKTVSAEIVETKVTGFSQNGYSGTAGYGSRPFKGGVTYLTLVKYKYRVDEKEYSSWFFGFKLPFGSPDFWKQKQQSKEQIQAYVFPYYPDFSILSRGISFAVIAFVLVGLGLYQIRIWLTKQLVKYHNE